MGEDKVEFSHRDREVLRLICAGADSKTIAGALDIAISTVNARINDMCERAQVARTELLIYVLQHPGCLAKGAGSDPGLHIPPCDCGSPYCLGMIAAELVVAESTKPASRDAARFSSIPAARTL